MNAPILVLRQPAPNSASPLPFEPSLGLALASLWEEHTERLVLGAAMLGEPMPRWLRPEHFFASQHQRIYEAVQDVGGNVAHVNAWLRESSPPTGPLVVKSTELAAMLLDYDFERRMGWVVLSEKLETIRELWRRRQLLEQCARLVIQLRGGQLDHDGAYRVLKAHFKECR
jgi:hypothetical protein